MLNTDPTSPDFNSYASVSDLRDFSTARGYDIPTDDTTCKQLLVQAMDYLDSVNWKGSRSAIGQPLAWPRDRVFIDGEEIDKSIIPTRIKQAQCRLAVEAQETDLNPTQSGGAVTMERIEGAVTVQYDGSSNDGTVSFPWLNAMLRGLTKSGCVFNFDVRRG
ncbi:DnaT-like ssDNA-binding protein [Erwinia sp. 9145]|uniref:DnaT-like ssDNA-binding protein n=1 Tax=Erwinia sp. 9145 TaxID=1500895 RepID=UPI00055582CF|nr:DnaT-like ssDNA-binding protein [Erwinia sp. 9145]